MFPFTSQRKNEQLLQQCTEWFAAHHVRLVTYARQQADSSTDVELLVMTTVTQVTRALCEGRVSTDDLLPYTLRSLFNAAARLREQNLRRYRTEQCYGGQLSSLPEHPACADTTPDDRRLQLRRAVRELPPELATVVTLRIWDELTFPDMAVRLGLPESTLRSRYTAALKRIKSKISTDDR